MENFMKTLKLLLLILMGPNVIAMQKLPSINESSDFLNKIRFDFDNNSPTDRTICAYITSECDENQDLIEEEIAHIHYAQGSNSINWEIKKIHTDSNYRSKGIGSSLFKRCLQDLKNLNAYRVYWTVAPSHDSKVSITGLEEWYKYLLDTQISNIPGSYSVIKDINPIIIFTFEKNGVSI